MEIRIPKDKLRLRLRDISDQFGGRHSFVQLNPDTQRIYDWSLHSNYALLLEFKEEEDTLVVTSNHEKERFVDNLKEHLMPEQYRQFSEAFLGTELELPVRTASEEARAEALAEKDRDFRDILAIGQPYNSGHGKFTTLDAHMVLQGEYAVTSASEKYPIIGTFGAGPCVIVSVYNPDTCQASLAHVDANTPISSLHTLISELGEGPLQAHLAGGTSGTIEQVKQIIEFFSSRNIEIHSTDLIGDGESSKQLAIDARTGEIFTDFRPEQLRRPEDMNFKMRSREMENMNGKAPLSRANFEPPLMQFTQSLPASVSVAIRKALFDMKSESIEEKPELHDIKGQIGPK